MTPTERFGAGLAVVVLLVACTPAESPAPVRRTMTGSFTIELPAGEDFTDLGDGTCVGAGKYADLAPGALVRVTSPTQQLLGEGQLSEGITPPDEFHPVGCKFFWEVTDLPDLGRYVIQVADQPHVFLPSYWLKGQDWQIEFSVDELS